MTVADIRVLVVDDEPAIRSALTLLIDSEPSMSVVAAATNGQEAVELALTRNPDVVLMDVQMPQMTGIDAARIIGELPNGPRVLVLTTFDLQEYVYGALRAGASGFLLKNSPPAEILRAIQVIHEGNALLSPEVTKQLVSRFTTHRHDTRLDNLTARERETLVLIGRGHSNAEIATELVVTPTTVRTYVSRILAKMRARDRAQLVVLAYESGLIGASAL